MNLSKMALEILLFHQVYESFGIGSDFFTTQI